MRKSRHNHPPTYQYRLYRDKDRYKPEVPRSRMQAAQFYFCKFVEHQTEGWVRHSMLR
jgi:hypothetical protein